MAQELRPPAGPLLRNLSQSTATHSTDSPELSSKKAVNLRRESSPRSPSVASAGSHKSKYSQKGTLRKCSLFDQMELDRSEANEGRLLRDRLEQRDLLGDNVRRLRARAAYLRGQTRLMREGVAGESRRLRATLLGYFSPLNK